MLKQEYKNLLSCGCPHVTLVNLQLSLQTAKCLFARPVVQIAPVLAVLREMVGQRSTRTWAGKLPRKVFLIWSSRHKAEFTILDEPLVAAAL